MDTLGDVRKAGVVNEDLESTGEGETDHGNAYKGGLRVAEPVVRPGGQAEFVQRFVQQALAGVNQAAPDKLNSDGGHHDGDQEQNAVKIAASLIGQGEDELGHEHRDGEANKNGNQGEQHHVEEGGPDHGVVRKEFLIVRQADKAGFAAHFELVQGFAEGPDYGQVHEHRDQDHGGREQRVATQREAQAVP